MKNDIVPMTSSAHVTSDFGVKIPSHDIWLSASTGDRQGPQLLEDNFGREKVGLLLIHQRPLSVNKSLTILHRSADSIMSVSPSELSMPVVLVLLENSNSMRVLRTSPTQVY